MNLIFIRHGDPDYSIDSLTEKGWKKAELLSARTTKWDVKEFNVDVKDPETGNNRIPWDFMPNY